MVLADEGTRSAAEVASQYGEEVTHYLRYGNLLSSLAPALCVACPGNGRESQYVAGAAQGVSFPL